MKIIVGGRAKAVLRSGQIFAIESHHGEKGNRTRHPLHNHVTAIGRTLYDCLTTSVYPLYTHDLLTVHDDLKPSILNIIIYVDIQRSYHLICRTYRGFPVG